MCAYHLETKIYLVRDNENVRTFIPCTLPKGLSYKRTVNNASLWDVRHE